MGGFRENGDADKKQKAVDVLGMETADFDTLQLRFLTGPIIPTTAPFWSSMQNSQNMVGSQRWESSVLCCSEQRCSCLGPTEGMLLFVFESQGERGEMRKRALMMVLGKFERVILMTLLTSSQSLVVAAVCLCFTLVQLSEHSALDYLAILHTSHVLSSLSPFILLRLRRAVIFIID